MSDHKKNCETYCSDSNVMVKHGQRKAVFVNKKRHCFRVIEYDGCFVKQKTAADYIVTKKDVGHIIVELKGRDVPHAIKQIHATAENWFVAYGSGLRVAGLIVASCIPKCSTVSQIGRQKFHKRFKGHLKITSSQYEFEFEEVFGG